MRFANRDLPALLFAGLLSSGCGLRDMSAAPTEVSQAIDALFLTADQGTWAATYETQTTAGLRQNFSKENYDKLGRAIHDRLGKLVSKSSKSFFVKSMNGVVTVDASYDAQFDKGKGTIRATLVKTGGIWRYQGLWVGSPEFLEASTVPCASCGKPRPKDASFCPACGTKIDPAQAPPPGK